jgi:hypothetical protein
VAVDADVYEMLCALGVKQVSGWGAIEAVLRGGRARGPAEVVVVPAVGVVPRPLVNVAVGADLVVTL